MASEDQTINKKVAAQEVFNKLITVKKLALFAIIASILIIPLSKQLILVGAVALPLWMYCGITFNKAKQEMELLQKKYSLIDNSIEQTIREQVQKKQ